MYNACICASRIDFGFNHLLKWMCHNTLECEYQRTSCTCLNMPNTQGELRGVVSNEQGNMLGSPVRKKISHILVLVSLNHKLQPLKHKILGSSSADNAERISTNIIFFFHLTGRSSFGSWCWSLNALYAAGDRKGLLHANTKEGTQIYLNWRI